MGNRISLKGRGADIFFGPSAEIPHPAEAPPSVAEPMPSVATMPTSSRPENHPEQSAPAESLQVTEQVRKQASLQTSKLASKQGGSNAQVEKSLEKKLAAVLTTDARKANTFRYTQEELDAIRDTVYRLETVYGRKIDKNDVVRIALNWLISDFEDYQEASLLVRILASK